MGHYLSNKIENEEHSGEEAYYGGVIGFDICTRGRDKERQNEDL